MMLYREFFSTPLERPVAEKIKQGQSVWNMGAH